MREERRAGATNKNWHVHRVRWPGRMQRRLAEIELLMEEIQIECHILHHTIADSIVQCGIA